MEQNFQQAEPISAATEVRRFREGDPDAAEALARRATRLALRTAAALLESREEATDVAQDVAVDALRSLGKLRGPGAFDTWVHRITVRHTLRRLKRRRRTRAAETPLALRSRYGDGAAKVCDELKAGKAGVRSDGLASTFETLGSGGCRSAFSRCGTPVLT
jgi:DNA-directed RNA polymerase specialized sigma24 family protein